MCHIHMRFNYFNNINDGEFEKFMMWPDATTVCTREYVAACAMTLYTATGVSKPRQNLKTLFFFLFFFCLIL